MAKISVIMPVYNSEKYLEIALDSIVNQTLEDIEIICINDASKDGSLSILEKYEKVDSRIKIINNLKNFGPGYSRNLGLEHAKGEYIAFVDADDFFESDMLELTYEECVKYDLDIGVIKASYFDTVSNKCFRNSWVPSIMPTGIFTYDDVKGYAYTMFCGWSWDKIMKREFVEDNKLRFSNHKMGEDMSFSYLGLLLARKIKYISSDKALYYYRRNTQESLSENVINNLDDPYLVLKDLEHSFKEIVLYEKCKYDFINLCLAFLLNIFNGLKYNKKDYFEKMKYEYFPNLKLDSFTYDCFFNKYNYYRYRLIVENDFSEVLMEQHFSGFNIKDLFLANAEKIRDLFGYFEDNNMKVGIWEEWQNGFADEFIEFCKENGFKTVKTEEADVIIVTNSNYYEEADKVFDKTLFDLDAYLRFGLEIGKCLK